jgi:hypothetical protein
LPPQSVLLSSAMAKDDMSHAAPASAKATAAGVAGFFLLILVAAIVYAIAGG